LLRVYGEHGYPMPALSLPPRDQKKTIEQLAQFDAIKLFVARAEAVQSGFALTAGNAQVITAICLRLDGVPLAIELATAQLGHFTLPKLHDALNEAPLQSLASSIRDMEPRQRTLRNSIQWSYNLLSVAERAAFNRLGVFVGGCTTEAALAVCELPDDATLHALADRSLLKRDANERWTMLEMIREFALDALAQSADDALKQARQRHAEYFARFLEAEMHAVDPRGFSRVMEVEQHNARAALRWLIDHKDPLAGMLANCIGGYLVGSGSQTEDRRLLREVLSADIELPLATRNDLLATASICAWQRHDFEEALRYGHEALAVSRAMNSPSRVAEDLISFSHVYIEMDDCAQAKEVALEAVQVGRTVQDSVALVGALGELGQAELTLGDVGQAEACFREAYALCQVPGFGQHVYWGHACLGMGEIALSHHNYDQSLEFLREGVQRSAYATTQLCILSPLAGVIGTMPRPTPADVQRAAKIWGAVEALTEKLGTAFAPCFRRRTDALIAEARSRISPKTFAAAWAEGRELSLDEAIALAMMD